MAKVKFQVDSLARRMRPRTFDEVIGQPKAVSTLQGMIKRREIPNAIMFTGTRGTGKTTLATVFARMLNCERGTACGECASCKYEGNHPDIKMLNAASARGIDETRKVIETANYKPRHNVRVIIMDEAHQLTPQAAEALLIPLENPPEDTMYIMCTTEPQKFTGTMLSRCTVIPLELPDKLSIAKRLNQVAKHEKAKFSKEVLIAMAEASEGVVREALNLLEVGINLRATDPDISDKELIKTVSTNAQVEDSLVATTLLLGMYANKPALVAKAVFQVSNAVQALNAAIFLNQYVIGTEVGADGKHVWHSPANRDFKKALESKVKEGRRTIECKLAVHKRLITLRNELHNVPTSEVGMMLSYLV